MKVILLENIKGVGKKDEIIEAKEGYARNFLIPKKKAVEATPSNMSLHNSKMAKIEYDKEVLYNEALKQKEEIEKLNIIIEAKVGDNDRLFGTITQKDIAQKIESYGIKIDKKKINIKENIKTTGIYLIELKLNEKVTAKARIMIKGIRG